MTSDLSVAALLREAGWRPKPKPEPLRWDITGYHVRVLRGERVVRSAVLNLHGWHVPLPGGRYRSYGTRAEAIYALGGVW